MKIYNLMARQSLLGFNDIKLTFFGLFTSIMIMISAATAGSLVPEIYSGSVAIHEDKTVVRIILSIPFVFTFLCFAFPILDKLISMAVRFVTEHKYDVEHFFVSRIMSSDVKNINIISFSLGNGFIGILIAVAATFIKLIFFTSGLMSTIALIIALAIGFIFAILHLARWVFNLQFKLKNHINDPNAHSNVGNNHE